MILRFFLLQVRFNCSRPDGWPYIFNFGVGFSTVADCSTYGGPKHIFSWYSSKYQLPSTVIGGLSLLSDPFRVSYLILSDRTPLMFTIPRLSLTGQRNRFGFRPVHDARYDTLSGNSGASGIYILDSRI